MYRESSIALNRSICQMHTFDVSVHMNPELHYSASHNHITVIQQTWLYNQQNTH